MGIEIDLLGLLYFVLGLEDILDGRLDTCIEVSLSMKSVIEESALRHADCSDSENRNLFSSLNQGSIMN